MRILFVNSARRFGGGITSALDLAAGLADAGHRVTVVCHPASEIHGRIASDRRIETIGIPIRPELNFWRAVQLRREMQRVRPDIVLADKRKDVKFSFWARARDRRPAILHRHGAPSPLRDGAIYRFVWSRIQGVIVNSAAMREEMLRRTPWLSAVPIHVVHNGKDLDRYRPMPERRAAVRASLGIGEEEYVACFHAVFGPRKRVGDLIRAAALLGGTGSAAGPSPGPAVRLLLVGDGPDEARLRGLATELGVQATFTGNRADVPELLAAADVAVHLSDAEGFSNSVVEALACGLPVIANRAHSHPEQIDDGRTGRLVPGGDPAALAGALVEFADPATRRQAGAAARSAAQARMGRDRMVAAYAEAFAATLGLDREAAR